MGLKDKFLGPILLLCERLASLKVVVHPKVRRSTRENYGDVRRVKGTKLAYLVRQRPLIGWKGGERDEKYNHTNGSSAPYSGA